MIAEGTVPAKKKIKPKVKILKSSADPEKLLPKTSEIIGVPTKANTARAKAIRTTIPNDLNAKTLAFSFVSKEVKRGASTLVKLPAN